MLSKYPVTTDRGEYRVTIKNIYWYDDGGDIYKVEIFEPYIKWKLFRRFRLVATLRAEEKYRNDFVKVARHSVLNYKERLIERGARIYKMFAVVRILFATHSQKCPYRMEPMCSRYKKYSDILR